MEIFDQEKTQGKLILQFIWKYRITLVLVFIISAVGAGVATNFMQPEYRSNGIIFPTNSNRLEVVMQNPQFGFDLDADRLMQILSSRQMQEGVIAKFDLAQHYKLDTTELDWRSTLNLNFISDITYFRSKYMSIVISAQTTSPELSADIVNYIIDTLDVMRENIFKDNMMMQYNAVLSNYEENQRLVMSLNDTLQSLFDQNETYRHLYYQFRLGDWRNGLQLSADQMSMIEPVSERLIASYVYEIERLTESKKLLDVVADKIEKPFPGVYQIDRAVPSYFKEWPSVPVNVGLTSLVALIGTLIVLYLKEQISEK
ncbi:MAG: hypothetical protein ACI9FU_001327 [Granulosicoccus sp.]|jgi:hypothetical protein